MKGFRLFLIMFTLVLPLAAQAEYTVLFLGDSLTEGYGLEAGQSFPSLVEQRLQAEGREDIRVINGGISGSTSASAISRLQWFMRSAPDLMVLSLGANDGLRGLSVVQLRENLEKTITLARDNGIEVALTGMMVPPNMGEDYAMEFATVFPELAQKYQLPLMPFLLDGVAAIPELNQADGIHPNIRGTRIVADNVYAFLIPLLPPRH